MASPNKYVQTNTLYLAGSGTIVGATSFSVTSLTDIYGNVLTMADFGTTGYFTLEPDTTNEESGTFTGIVANANGTYTFTGVSSTLAKSPYTATSGLVRQHAGGSKMVITDNVAFWNTFANKANDETITGQWTFSVFPVTPATPDASTTVKGMTKLSTAPALSTNPIAVGDNDIRVPTANPTTLFAPIGAAPIVQIFTSNGTYTKTNGIRYAIIEVQGPGGNGGASSGSGSGYIAGAGGGGGGYTRKMATNAVLGATETVVVGTSAGTASSITVTGSGTMTANSGATASSSTHGNGGSAGGGDLNIAGQNGSDTIGVNGTSSSFSIGGDSFLGKGGPASVSFSPNLAGSNYGGGGANGGNGATGIVIITEYFL